ncbi:hypothetical protein MCOR02_004535 [Pyricularia oryzae]|uniref:Uncharacterized protein n=1 Tax=Pyricularia oryzae TaxID=318829 RepID=A0A4P7MVK5_PYROR|nr:hypothetical protein MCOR01_006242 [Pyricularia oryzae]KAH9435613.1 hypothetical protein MCOR02_004535 [Pyricularia oryzae]KAI6252846.1 hypothetical protein MCOR19_010570 [Pyricularia oryzae]KAI6387215.1 hypothetical protein MCOR23_011188 [Pyricularia oryzae]KAI6391551.1 hypothetical protein MCOR20_011340 [Pyricularia oryzae]
MGQGGDPTRVILAAGVLGAPARHIKRLGMVKDCLSFGECGPEWDEPDTVDWRFAQHRIREMCWLVGSVQKDGPTEPGVVKIHPPRRLALKSHTPQG